MVLGLADEELAVATGARNLALAEQAGADLLVMCNGCYESLVEADAKLQHDPGLRERVNAALAAIGCRYEGGTRIRHFVEFLHDAVGLEPIRAAVGRQPGIATAIHPGCHLFREPGDADPLRKPHMLRALTEAVGLPVVEYGLERLCCGFPISQFDKTAAVQERLVPKLRALKATPAEAMVFCCPACLNQFESGQDAAKPFGFERPYPCMHLLELLGLSLGMTPAELGLDARPAVTRAFAARFAS